MAALRISMDITCPFLEAKRLSRSLLVLALVLTVAKLASAQKPPAIPAALEDKEHTITLRADRQVKEKQVFHLNGHVVVTLRDWKLTADQATYDESTGEVVAKGHVTFDDPSAHLEADEAHYNVQTAKGWFSNASGYVRPAVRPRARMLSSGSPFYFHGRRVQRLDERTYIVDHGRVTTCECEDKGWTISAQRANVDVGNKVVSHGAIFRFLRLPIFYSPVLINSIGEHPRRAGILLPQIGNSGQKGFTFGDGVFLPLNRSSDLSLGVMDYTRRGLGGVGRFRMVPSSTSYLAVNFFGVNDHGLASKPQLKAPGASLQVQGKAENLGNGFRGVVTVDYISSLAFRQTFSDSFTEAVTSEARQVGFVTKSFSAYSLNFFASRYQNFLSSARKVGNSIIIDHAPSVSFSGMDRQVGRTPFFFSFDSSVDGVERTQPGSEGPLSERTDFHPTITVRSKPFWGFHLTPSIGMRATHYGTSLAANQEPLTRLLGEVSLDLRPPSFARVFSSSFKGHRFKHVVEPDIQYHLVRAHDAENIMDIVRYDQLDILAETNEIEYSLTNTLFTRKDAPAGSDETPQARELISWRLSQKYYFDPTFGGALEPGKEIVFDPTISLTGFAFAQGRRLSPLVSVLKVAPFSNYDTEMRADFSPSGGGVLNAGITSHLRRGRTGLTVADFYVSKTEALLQPRPPSTPLSQVTSFHLLRVMASYGEAGRKGLSGAAGVDYNFAQGIAHQVVGQVSYNFGCFAVDFEYRRFALGAIRRENQFRVAVSLANVGTFGNLKPREILY
jgi:LPS-assembly protein